MRKEVLFAVIFGIILGAIILYGVQLANKSISDLNSTPLISPNIETNSESTIAATKNNFQIVSPQDHAVLADTTTTLRGTAKPGSTVAIVTESDDLIIETSPEGTFSAQINLIGGENKITVTVLSQDQTTQSLSITVIRTDTLPE